MHLLPVQHQLSSLLKRNWCYTKLSTYELVDQVIEPATLCTSRRQRNILANLDNYVLNQLFDNCHFDVIYTISMHHALEKFTENVNNLCIKVK